MFEQVDRDGDETALWVLGDIGGGCVRWHEPFGFEGDKDASGQR